MINLTMRFVKAALFSMNGLRDAAPSVLGKAEKASAVDRRYHRHAGAAAMYVGDLFGLLSNRCIWRIIGH